MLWRLTYSVPTSFLHRCRRWCTISLCPPQNLDLLSFTNPLIFFHALVSIIYFCNLNTQQTFVLMKTSWRRLEEVFCLHLQKTSSRRLDQDEYIRLRYTSSKEVLIKTNIFFLVMRLQDAFKTFSGRLQGVFKTSCQNGFKTFSRHLQAVLQKRLQDFFNMPSRHLQEVFPWRL